MNLQLKDKIIVVSGGVKSINESIINILAKEGAVPVIIGADEKDNSKTINELNSNGNKYFHAAAELTKPEACKESIDKIINYFGEINGLVNIAEVHTQVALEHGNCELFITSLQKNLVHFYLFTHYALPALIKSKGAIVNINFKAVNINQKNKVACAAGNGINALTREWAVELLKYDIRVNEVIAENITEEIANTVAFLLSEKSSHTTGQLIHA